MNSDSVVDKLGGTTTIIVSIVMFVSIAFLGILIASRQGTLTNQEEEIVNWAVEIGADREQFVEDFTGDAVTEIIEAHDAEYVERFGENRSTPTIVIDGEQVANRPYAQFVEVVEQELEEIANDESRDLPLIIEEFSDFNCPACAQFNVVKYQLKQTYENQLDFESKNLLVINQTTSVDYAKAFEAAKLQNLGDEMQRKLFQEIHNTEDQYIEPPVLTDPTTSEDTMEEDTSEGAPVETDSSEEVVEVETPTQN